MRNAVSGRYGDYIVATTIGSNATQPFVPTSPAITTAETAILYPALCFLEATNLSEGRGTAYPFRVCGAPWINGLELAAAFATLGIPGVLARNVFFTPLETKFAHQLCQGIMLHITDFTTFRPVKTGLLLIHLLRQLYPARFAWHPYPTHVNSNGANHFDLLVGNLDVREMLESGPKEIAQELDKLLSIPDWPKAVEKALLYT